MIDRNLRWLLVLSALTACGGDDSHATDCARETECSESPAQGSNSADGGKAGSSDSASRDGGAGGAGAIGKTPSSDAGTSNGTSDAGTISKTPSADAGTSVNAIDAGKAAQDAAAPATHDAGGMAATGDVKPSAGCGSAAPAGGDSKIDVMGTSREFILTLPKGYDPKKPYKLVFAWHGLGGTAAQIANGYYGLQTQANNGTIFVAGQGLQTSNSVGSGPGWPNTNGQDVAFVKAMYAQFQKQLCFDESRVFSVGMSYGGIMSDTLGCQMGDVFRAIAPMSGAGPGYGGAGPKCTGQVAVWSSHGNADTTVPTAQGEASRDFWVKSNHCQSTTMPVDPDPCVAYVGCDAGYPVTWCEFAGGHTIPSFAAKAIWTFLSQF